MRVLGFAVLAALIASAAAKAAVVEEFKAEDWDGLAFTSDETGQFTHCSVYATYRNGSTLYISYEAGDTWFFSVLNDSWKLTAGGSFAIKFQVDRRGELEGTGTALGPTQIGLPVERDHPFVGQLRRGNELVISFQNQDYHFELSNSNKAMNAAEDCAHRHVALGTHTPVMSRNPEQPAAQEPEQTATEQPAAQESEQTATEQPAAPESTTADNGGSSSSDVDKPAQASGEQQAFGPWVVTATDDGNGAFVNCTAYDVQGDDQLILSYFPDKVWTFGLYRAAWKLDTNQTYYLWYNVDAPADAPGVTKRPVEAAEPTRIYFEVSDVEDIIDKIENGKTLNIRFRGVTGSAGTYSYSLDQAHAAFEATRKCVADHAGTAETAEAPSSGEAVTKEGGAKGQQAADQFEESPATAEANSTESETSTADSGATATPAEEESTPQALPVLGMNKIEDLEVPGWKAAAFALDNGAFTHCAIKAEYQNGATLGFALTAEGELVLAVQHGDWSLTAGAWAPISYTLKADTSYSDSGQGQAVDTNVIMADIGGKEDLGETLKGAREVDVQAEGKDLSFDTSDIGPALDAIEECVAQHASEPAASQAPAGKKVEGPAGKAESETATAPPTEGQTSPPSSDAGSADTQVASTGNAATEDVEALQTEAAGYTTALLFRSGYPNHVIVKGDDVPEAFRSHRAMWKLADLVGVTDMVAGTVKEITEQIFSSDVRDCAGIATMAVDGQSGASEHMHTVCQNGASTITVHYLIIPRDAGGSYMLSFIDTGDGSSAKTVADKVYSTAVPM